MKEVENLKPYISAELRKLRAAKGINQRELADSIGVNVGTIVNYEQGENDMVLSTLESLINFYSIDFIIFFKNVYENIHNNLKK